MNQDDFCYVFVKNGPDVTAEEIESNQQLCQVKIEEIVIESKVGDVIYCTLKMIDNKNNRAYNILSLSDGIILSRITNCPFKSWANVWDIFDEIDEWDYEDYIVDIYPDED